MPVKAFEGQTILVEEGKMTWNEKGKAQFSFKFVLAQTATPKDVDLLDVADDGEGKKLPLKCIYAVEKDVLRVCFHHGVSRFTFHPYVHPDLPRPKNFGPGEHPTVLIVFKRVKK